ncbi:luciferase family protein [Halobacteriaceae archaeon GCM10025711]
MGENQAEPEPAPVAELVGRVGAWNHVETAARRTGGTAFRVGDREFGHVHASGALDIDFTLALRDHLVESGLTDEHNLFPDSGWTTYHVAGDHDVDRAEWLLRLSYLYHVLHLWRRPSMRRQLRDVDVHASLHDLDPEQSVIDAFDGLLAR